MEWLKSNLIYTENKGKILDYMEKTFSYRRSSLKDLKGFSQILAEYPRFRDLEGQLVSGLHCCLEFLQSASFLSLFFNVKLKKVIADFLHLFPKAASFTENFVAKYSKRLDILAKEFNVTLESGDGINVEIKKEKLKIILFIRFYRGSESPHPVAQAVPLHSEGNGLVQQRPGSLCVLLKGKLLLQLKEKLRKFTSLFFFFKGEL